MRLALIGPVYPYRGGIAHYTTLMARRLALVHDLCLISFRRQYPTWLFPGRSDKDPSTEALRVGDINVQYILDPLNPVSWFKTVRALKIFKPDALLLQWWVPFWAPSFATILYLYRRLFSSSPVVVFCHNIVPHESRWWDIWLSRSVLSLPDYCVVHSTSDKIHLLKLIPEAHITVAQFPQYENLISRRNTREQARNLVGVPQDIPVLLFFGFVRPYKGLEYLLRSLVKVRGVIPAHLLIVGEFWQDKQDYLDLIDELGIASAVTIVDEYVPNEEIAQYFDAANVLVLPYIETSQSAVLQLAFETGTPVIASNTGGLGESVTEGVNGLLVKPGDVDALADIILRYLQMDFESVLREKMTGGQTDRWAALISKVEALISGG